MMVRYPRSRTFCIILLLLFVVQLEAPKIPGSFKKKFNSFRVFVAHTAHLQVCLAPQVCRCLRVFDRSEPLASDLLGGLRFNSNVERTGTSDVARSSVKVGPTPHQCRSDEDSSCSSAFISHSCELILLATDKP